MKISLKVNGQMQEADVPHRLLLVRFLRENLALTGTHIGCDTSQCGACTVFVNGSSAKSCTIFAVQADGAEIMTIEGLSTDDWHPVQEGFREEYGLQCGYCTPGMIMASYQLLLRNPNPTESEIRSGIHGNICRCTGYQNIIKAVQYAARKMSLR